ncbi:MAG: lysozyme [Arenicella sp.]|jgi:lysozyme
MLATLCISKTGNLHMKFSKYLISLFYISVLSVCFAEDYPAASKNTDNYSEIIGIDISKYQGTVDFKKVKADRIRYVFVRATEGITYQDADFESNIANARAVGLATGAYHFYETNDDPLSQFENFKSVVSLRSGDLPPVIDIEKLHNKDQSNLIDNIHIFLKALETHYRVKPIIYSGQNFANEYLTQLGDYPLWLAQYEVGEPNIPEGWGNWTFWQWSQSTTVNGIDGQVDGDRFNGDELIFRGLLIK